MPRLRFTRDERGYEHTFLVHTAGRRGKERTRILYWFRSPPSVRVGRAAFDPDAIRAIEEANPAIVFDWPAILESHPPEPEPAESWRARRGRVGRGRPVSPTPASSTIVDPARTQADRSVSPPPSALAASPAETGEPDGDHESTGAEPSAVQRLLGFEGLTRVRARYAEVVARISSQITDAAVADELRGLAERLNPDAWVTEGDVRIGLEEFERVLENVRQRLGPPPRRRGPRPAAPRADPSGTANSNVAVTSVDPVITDS